MEKGVPAKVSKTLWISRRQRGRYIVSEKEIKCYTPTYRIYSIKRPAFYWYLFILLGGGGGGERGRFWLWALIELESRRGRGGRLFEVGLLFG